MLRADNAQTAEVRQSLAAFIKENNALLDAAFKYYDGRDQVGAEHLAAAYRLFEAIEKVASDKLKKDLQYFRQFIPVMEGRDLQSALIAFDKAYPGDFKGQSKSRKVQESRARTGFKTLNLGFFNFQFYVQDKT